MREVPKKNYIIFLLMVVAVVIVVLYLSETHKTRISHKYISPMNNFVTEIKVDDIENYIIENPLVVIYVSDKKDETLKDREEDFKELLTEYNIQRYFVYLDMSIDTELVSNNFENKYHKELYYENLPILFVMIDGQVVDVYNEKNYDTTKIIAFLKKNEVIEID